MSKKRKGNYKKTPAQLQGYRDFISNASFSPPGTVPVNNEMLQGSAEYRYDEGKLDSSDNIKRTPFRYRFADWLKKNIYPAIITAIITAIGTAVISHQVNLAVVNKQIEYIENRLEQIESDYVGKDALQLRINEIASNIDSSYSITLNDIKWQLKEIEEELDRMQEP